MNHLSIHYDTCIHLSTTCRGDFDAALNKAHCSVGQDELAKYEKWTEEFGQDG